jgi:hypothetical protein
VLHVKIANWTEITKQVDSVASLVGTKQLFLKMGEILYNKGAEIGLSRDGTVAKSNGELALSSIGPRSLKAWFLNWAYSLSN